MRIIIGSTADTSRVEVRENIVGDPECPADKLDASDHIEVGNFHLKGLRLESIDHAQAMLTVNLKPGSFEFPGLYRKAETKIPPNCIAKAKLQLGKNEVSGSMMISAVEVSFSEIIVIENPTSAFVEPQEHFWSRTFSAVADHVAKIHLRGLSVGKDGVVHLDGSLVKGGYLHSPLSDVVGNELTSLDLDLRHLAKTVSPTQKDLSFGYQFVQTLGKVVGKTRYSMDLGISPTVLSVHADQLDVLTQKRGAQAHIEGELALNESLDFLLTAEAQSSFLDCLLGHMIVGGSVKIDRSLSALAHAAFNFDGHITDLPGLYANGHHISATAASIFATGSADVSSDATHHFSHGNGELTCELSNPRIKMNQGSVHLAGEIGARLRIRDLAGDSRDGAISFRGDIAAYLRSHELRKIGFNFSLDKSGRLSLVRSKNPGQDLVSQALSPSSQTPPSLIREGNRAELLVDGIQSYPRRLQLVLEAQESIWLQTHSFQDDVSGKVTAKALADAAKRGVQVRVIVDSQGENDLYFAVAPNSAIQMLREAGVDVRIHNDAGISALRDIVDVLIDNGLTHNSKDELLKGPITNLVAAISHNIVQLQKGLLVIDGVEKEKFQRAINRGLHRPENTSIDMDHPIFQTDATESIELTGLFDCLQEALHQLYSWHENHFLVDGQRAILGGMNVADAYMFGGRLFRNRLNEVTEGWRDTDILIDGPAVDDVAASFANNWLQLTGETISARPFEFDETARLPGDNVKIQVIKHSPSIDGHNAIADFILSHIDKLEPRESALFENAHFCMGGHLSHLSKAMLSAARRGVNIVVLTNSTMTSEEPSINHAAFQTYKDLLNGGVRIFERKDKRTIHSKIAVLGSDVSIVGSADLDERSARLNSEVIAAVYDADFAKKQRAVIEADLSPRVAHEITVSDLASVSILQNAQSAAMSLFRELW